MWVGFFLSGITAGIDDLLNLIDNYNLITEFSVQFFLVWGHCRHDNLIDNYNLLSSQCSFF